MSKTAGLRLAAAIALAAAPALTLAADSATVSVTATVKAVCKLSASTYSMGFGTLDPSATGSPNGTGTATIGYTCTKGTAPSSVSVGGVSNGTTGFSSSSSAAASAGGDLASTSNSATNTDRLPYKITWTTPTTAGTGLGATATTFDLTGTITYANYSTVTADSYSGAVGISIAP